ncbi:MAG: GNAT family N-acetyltransferase [Rhodothermales bacterium]|nr:GNAT family N-acetyltransferase [Rhodothermales bacterium]
MATSDAPALLDIWNRAARFDTISDDVFHEKAWLDDGVDADLRLVAEVDGSAAAFAVGAVRQKDQGPSGYIKMMAVRPELQRNGLGSDLLSRLEHELRRRGTRVCRPGESAPNYLTPGVDLRYTKATVFFEKRGYEKIGQSYNMEAELENIDLDTTGDEEPLAMTGFRIGRAAESDRSDVMAMLAEHWPSWQDEVGVSLSNDPVSLFVARRDDKVVAFSAYETNNRGTGWFGPMGTAPDARGHGIGSVLLKRCLVDLRDAGYRRAIIPWVAPISFYLHHVGAEVCRVFNRYEKQLDDHSPSD